MAVCGLADVDGAGVGAPAAGGSPNMVTANIAITVIAAAPRPATVKVLLIG
jgi:hypothetical protein